MKISMLFLIVICCFFSNFDSKKLNMYWSTTSFRNSCKSISVNYLFLKGSCLRRGATWSNARASDIIQSSLDIRTCFTFDGSQFRYNAFGRGNLMNYDCSGSAFLIHQEKIMLTCKNGGNTITQWISEGTFFSNRNGNIVC